MGIAFFDKFSGCKDKALQNFEKPVRLPYIPYARTVLHHLHPREFGV